MEEQFQRSRRVARAWAIWEQTDAEQRKHGDGRKRSGGVMIGDLEGFAFEYKRKREAVDFGRRIFIRNIFKDRKEKEVGTFCESNFFAGQRMVIGSTLLLRNRGKVQQMAIRSTKECQRMMKLQAFMLHRWG